MANDIAPLGEKIHRLRLERGMTQSSLAGDKITRNMLSMIESGAASPSVDTLVYLAARLGVSAGYFIPSTPDEERKQARLNVVDGLRRSYSAKDWETCVRLGSPYAEDDEIGYILACAHFSLAWERLGEYDVSASLGELDTAETVGGGTVYCGENFACAVRYTRLLAENLATDDIPEGMCDARGCGEHLPPDIPAYFVALKCLRAGEDSALNFPHTAHRAVHLAAAELAVEEEYTEAIRRLRRLLDDRELPPYMRYHVLGDLEVAADLAGNSRLAYNTAKQKLELINKCKV